MNKIIDVIYFTFNIQNEELESYKNEHCFGKI